MRQEIYFKYVDFKRSSIWTVTFPQSFSWICFYHSIMINSWRPRKYQWDVPEAISWMNNRYLFIMIRIKLMIHIFQRTSHFNSIPSVLQRISEISSFFTVMHFRCRQGPICKFRWLVTMCSISMMLYYPQPGMFIILCTASAFLSRRRRRTRIA